MDLVLSALYPTIKLSAHVQQRPREIQPSDAFLSLTHVQNHLIVDVDSDVKMVFV